MKNLVYLLLVFVVTNFAFSCVSDERPNERLKETYFIGLDYLDNGDSPTALDYFQQCLEIAKEPGFDDMIQFSKVYSQLSEIYHQQRLLEYELDALLNAMDCALKGRDTLLALRFEEFMVMPYGLLANIDSVISIAERVSKKYYDLGLDTLGNIKQKIALKGYIEKGQFDKARRCIEIYESGSGLFDENGDIKQGYEIYYYHKGLYYMGIEENDSAEICFQKLMRYKEDLNDREAASRGLLMLYRRLNNVDSIGKYAQLYCETNDTVTMKYKSEEISRMHSLYNYNSHKIEAERLSMTVKKQRLEILLSILMIAIISLLSYFFRKTNRLKMQNLESLYEEKLQQIDSLCLDKQEQETVINKLKLEAEVLQEKITKDNRETIREQGPELENLLSRLHEAAKDPVNGSHLISSSDWQELLFHLELLDHKFIAFIHQKDLSKLEVRATILMRLKFIDSEIMVLLNCFGSAYSNCKTRINTKLFKTESAKGLRSNITLWRS